jgi:hypothetical protein
MSERKWTLGPWFQSCESIDPDWHIVTTKGGGVIANVFAPQNANANLIAAAPDLYEALDNLVRAYHQGKDVYGWIDNAGHALAKAEGRT